MHSRSSAWSQNDIHTSVHYYTQRGQSLHAITPDRKGAPGGAPGATTMVLSTIFQILLSHSLAGNSVPSYPVCNIVHFFFNFTLRGITKSKGQVLYEYIRTYSEYIRMHFTQSIMHKYIHAYSLGCMHHKGEWRVTHP